MAEKTSHTSCTSFSWDEKKARDKKGAPRNPLVVLFAGAIRFYQKFISPLFPPCCIYEPTCSQYALEAIQKHGALAGSYLAVRRILRCYPFHKGGYDPVPEVVFVFGSRKVAQKKR